MESFSCFIGFTGNAFKKEKELKLKPQETANIGDYRLRYDALRPSADAHKETVTAKLSVWKNNQPFANIFPARVFFRSSIPGEPPQPSTEVSIKRSLKEDLFTALLTYDPKDQTVFLKTVVYPLVQFIWIGGMFLMFGGIIVMWPESRKRVRHA